MKVSKRKSISESEWNQNMRVSLTEQNENEERMREIVRELEIETEF